MRISDWSSDVCSSDLRIDTADALLKEDLRNVDLTEKRRKAGEGTLVEVLNAQSQYEADRGEIPQLGQQLAEARHLLAILIGVTPAELGPTEFHLADFTLPRSEEHTSELQSLMRNSYAVLRLTKTTRHQQKKK